MTRIENTGLCYLKVHGCLSHDIYISEDDHAQSAHHCDYTDDKNTVPRRGPGDQDGL